MKTAGRHNHANPPHSRYKSATNDSVMKPDRIIMPIHTQSIDEHPYRGKVVSFEYTDFEEIEAGSSSDYDEAAFQDFATDDPTRLRVTDRVSHG